MTKKPEQELIKNNIEKMLEMKIAHDIEKKQMELFLKKRDKKMNHFGGYAKIPILD